MVAWCAVRPVVFLAAALAASVAHAGGRPYAFTQGVDTLATDQLELESWFGAQTGRGAAGTIWEWWLGPVVGLTDRLEAGLFAIFGQQPEGPLALGSLRLQLSYSLADKGSWPVDVRDFGALNLTANVGAWLAFDLPGGEGTSRRAARHTWSSAWCS